MLLCFSWCICFVIETLCTSYWRPFVMVSIKEGTTWERWGTWVLIVIPCIYVIFKWMCDYHNCYPFLHFCFIDFLELSGIIKLVWNKTSFYCFLKRDQLLCRCLYLGYHVRITDVRICTRKDVMSETHWQILVQ